jgi:hypothetical protein
MKGIRDLCLIVSCAASSALAASSWTFDDATLTIQGKGAGVGGGVKEKYVLLLLSLNTPYTDVHVDYRLALRSRLPH